jgi:predicted nucleotide-binding protein
MATSRRRQPEQQPEAPALLTAPRDQVISEIGERIQRGEELEARDVSDESDVAKLKADYRTWDDYNFELLRRRFTTSEVADGYKSSPSMFWMEVSLHQEYTALVEDIAGCIRRLNSVRERVPLFDEAPTIASATPVSNTRAPTASMDRAIESIFIVHGHDNALKLGVDNFLRRATALEPVILHNQANRGRTVIEKFEAVGGRAGYAVVLFTGDDVGAAKAKTDELRPRARQNVVFEFGFFVGAIGRDHVAVIYEPGVELPTDLQGLVYIEYDHAGAWRASLLRELQAAGVDVDATALLG